MGFWVTTQNIQRLVSKLDWKFSDARIDKIRNNARRLARFDPANNRNLRNVARLMRIWPGGATESGAIEAKKWYGFLMWLHTQTNAATGNIIANDIRRTIFDGLTDPNCKSISFVAVEGPDVRLTSSRIDLAQPPGNLLVLVLQTIAHGNDPQPDPGPTDGNDSQDPTNEDFAIGSIRKARPEKPPKGRKTKPAAKSKDKSKKKKASKKRYAKK
jgi:hypothetical protein